MSRVGGGVFIAFSLSFRGGGAARPLPSRPHCTGAFRGLIWTPYLSHPFKALQDRVGQGGGWQ